MMPVVEEEKVVAMLPVPRLLRENVLWCRRVDKVHCPPSIRLFMILSVLSLRLLVVNVNLIMTRTHTLHTVSVRKACN